MKYLLILVLFTGVQGMSQTLDRQILGSYGGQGDQTDGKLLMQNIGEPVVATGINGAFVLNQGFEQPYCLTKNTLGFIRYEIINNITVYPNPGSDWLKMRINSSQNVKISIAMFDYNGKCVFEKPLSLEANRTTETTFETEVLAKSTYVIRFLSDDGRMLHSTQWIKN